MAYEKVLYEYFYQLDPFWFGGSASAIRIGCRPGIAPVSPDGFIGSNQHEANS